MPDLLQTGSDWLADQLKTHASRQVVYRRGAQQVAVQATVGRTLLKLDDGFGGVRMEWTDRDFLIHAADLVLGGTATLPERGGLGIAKALYKGVGLEVDLGAYLTQDYSDLFRGRFDPEFGVGLSVSS
ncbi:MAG: hypothetical protein K6T59_12500 [Bryobacteraceae bacterium]|jgi:hypothetical protein|nr:hypothetical protein [Bryobacteraceae bacterium]